VQRGKAGSRETNYMTTALLRIGNDGGLAIGSEVAKCGRQVLDFSLEMMLAGASVETEGSYGMLVS
jgi:hypothetical protein